MNRTDTTQPWELTSEQQQRLWRDIMPTYQGQVERCAQAVHTQRIAEDIVAGILRYNQSTEGIQRARQRARRPRGVSANGSLYRSSAAGTHMQSTEGQLRCGCAACLASLGPLARGYRRLR